MKFDPLKRRDFVSLLCSAATWPLRGAGVAAQTDAARRRADVVPQEFMQRLKLLGYELVAHERDAQDIAARPIETTTSSLATGIGPNREDDRN